MYYISVLTSRRSRVKSQSLFHSRCFFLPFLLAVSLVPKTLDRNSLVALSDCYHQLQPSSSTHSFLFLSIFTPLSNPPSSPLHTPRLSPLFLFFFFTQHLAELSRGLVSGSALQASPLLVILHQPWSKRRTGIHLIRSPAPPHPSSTSQPALLALSEMQCRGKHDQDGLHAPKWL